MKAEHLNSFIQGAQRILEQVCGSSGSLGKLFVKQSPYKSEAVSVIIGIVGDLKGDVVFTMDTDTAHFMASKLMMGMPVDCINEMSQSAISEMANMISGNVASFFFSSGITIDITPPIFVLQSEIEKFAFIAQGSKLICMPLIFEGGQIFEIDVLLDV